VFRRRAAAEPLPTIRGPLDVQAEGVDEGLSATVLNVDAACVHVTVGRTADGSDWTRARN
jgi:hypothetical protein